MTRGANFAIGALAAAATVFVTFNLSFELGADAAFCIVEYEQTGQSPRAISACRRSQIIEWRPVLGLRVAWLWLAGDEVQK